MTIHALSQDQNPQNPQNYTLRPYSGDCGDIGEGFKAEGGQFSIMAAMPTLDPSWSHEETKARLGFYAFALPYKDLGGSQQYIVVSDTGLHIYRDTRQGQRIIVNVPPAWRNPRSLSQIFVEAGFRTPGFYKRPYITRE